MYKIMTSLLSIYILLFLLTGCGSSIEVKKLDSYSINTGIPYYLPKPYLLITRGLPDIEYKPKITETKTEKPDGTKTTTVVTEQSAVINNMDTNRYSMKIIYLPDMGNRYGITLKSGTGSANTKITLENGWKLTSLTKITDTKIPETIEASAEFIGKAAPIALMTLIEKKPEASILIYEMVWDEDKEVMRFNLENPVFEWTAPKN